MNPTLALKVLGKVMNWDNSRAQPEFNWLSMMARLKYDDYQGFLAGARFVESLVDWLQQFEISERQVAYEFVRKRLVFFDAPQIQHLVELVYPETVQPRILRAAAERLNVPPYRVWATKDGTAEYDRLLRKSLFLGLSDGAHIDAFRRANVGILSNEQVVVSQEINVDKWTSLRTELRKDLEDPDARFEFIFLLDDFVGSGTTLLRFEDGKWTGKLGKFWLRVRDFQKTHLSDAFVTVVHHYMSTSKAKTNIPPREREAAQSGNWFPTPVEFSETMLLPESICIDKKTAGQFGQLIERYYDPSIETDSIKKGHTDAKYGFAAGGLPLILEHNTPNNSIALLWAESDGRGQARAMRPLFRRRQRFVR